VLGSEGGHVLAAFSPFYDENYKIVNNTFSLVIEDLAKKKRLKSIPVCSISGQYKKQDRGFLSSPPDLAFGDTFTIYREQAGYPWLAVNNGLDPIDHPLQKILNDSPQYFKDSPFTFFISAAAKQALVITRPPALKKNQLILIQWDKAPAIIPVPESATDGLLPNDYRFTLSPSGRWAYFPCGENAENAQYVMYLDPALPTGFLGPFYLGFSALIERATWVTNPEGLLLLCKGKLYYWDLSQFKAENLSKSAP
jgi:hypothetical protein